MVILFFIFPSQSIGQTECRVTASDVTRLQKMGKALAEWDIIPFSARAGWQKRMGFYPESVWTEKQFDEPLGNLVVSRNLLPEGKIVPEIKECGTWSRVSLPGDEVFFLWHVEGCPGEEGPWHNSPRLRTKNKGQAIEMGAWSREPIGAYCAGDFLVVLGDSCEDVYCSRIGLWHLPTGRRFTMESVRYAGEDCDEVGSPTVPMDLKKNIGPLTSVKILLTRAGFLLLSGTEGSVVVDPLHYSFGGIDLEKNKARSIRTGPNACKKQ